MLLLDNNRQIATQFKSAISGIFIAHYEIGAAFGALLQHFLDPRFDDRCYV
jgi:hypothetical protein